MRAYLEGYRGVKNIMKQEFEVMNNIKFNLKTYSNKICERIYFTHNENHLILLLASFIIDSGYFANFSRAMAFRLLETPICNL